MTPFKKSEILLFIPRCVALYMCKVYCDNTSTTSCLGIQMYTTNGYCVDGSILCVGDYCNIGTIAANGAKIYCGYNQITDYCSLYWNGDILPCNDFGSGIMQ